jgi:hypothetical protein
MRNEDTVVRQVVWQLRIPETITELYFRYIRGLPAWKRDFPQFVHPDVRNAVQIGHNRTRIVTVNSEYVFYFDERETLVIEAGERVRTGTLDVYCAEVLVVRVGVSPAEPSQGGLGWVPRSVEEYVEGAWVEELLALGPKLNAHESEQRAREQATHDVELRSIAELKAKFEPLPVAAKRGWLQRWMKI